MKYPYIKFYFRDWQANSELQTCSIEARGVWIEMMCIMAQSERFGYLERMGKAMDADLIARLIRVDKATLNPIIEELEGSGVFSRCAITGAIFSRRMVKDSEQAERFAEFGKRGGNPSLKSSSKRIPNAIPIAIPIPTEGLTLGVNPPLKPKSFKQWTQEDLHSEAIKNNADNLLSGENLLDFVGYWAQKTASGKMLFTTEKTFDVRRRINTAAKMIYNKPENRKQLPNTRIDANPANPALTW